MKTAAPRYRFAFILTTAAGNITRYQNLRRFAESDPSVEFTWATVSGYVGPSVSRYAALLPRVWVARYSVLMSILPVLWRLRSFDAVMIHQFEAEVVCVLRSRLMASPVLVASTDDAPIVDEARYPLYPFQQAKGPVRRAIRLRLDLWRARHFDRLIPFTRWSAKILVDGCGVPPSRVFPIHVGLDLGHWTRSAPRGPAIEGRFKILFVGGEFERKGGGLLLQVFEQRFAEVAELHLVSSNAPSSLPPNVYAHRNVTSDSHRLHDLYSECHALVVPTTADLAPWTYIEAMAMECPPIGSDVGAVSELIEDGVTGFVIPVGDATLLGDRIQSLISDADRRLRLARAGRAWVEQHYDAATNVPNILKVMKEASDSRRQV